MIIELNLEEYNAIIESRQNIFLENCLLAFDNQDISAEIINRVSEACLLLNENIFNESAIISIINEAEKTLDDEDKKFKNFIDNNKKKKINMGSLKAMSNKVEKKMGLSNGLLMGTAVAAAADIVKIIKSKGINKESRQEIKKAFNDRIDAFCKNFNNGFLNIDDNEQAKKCSKTKLKKAAVLLIQILLI